MPSRRLHETVYTPAPAGGPLRVEGGVIYGVRALGSTSRNRHGVAGVEATEYGPSARRDAVRLYEGCPVYTNHVRDPKATRSVAEAFGQLRGLREETAADGPVVVGDVHYLETHDDAPKVVEAVKRGIGLFGLSHDAVAGRERVDRGRKRLVIESLESVRSVDLVVGPATSRNLWESGEDQPVPNKITVRKLLEGHLTRRPKEPNRAAWAKRLLEDDAYAVPMTAEVDEPEDAADPDAAMDDAFEAAVVAIFRGEGTAEERLAKIGTLIETHEAMNADGDAPAVPGDGTPDPDKKEQADPVRELAGIKSALRLCESEKFTAAPDVLQALAQLPTDAGRLVMIRAAKAAAPAGGPGRVVPRSTPAGRRTTEQDVPSDDKALATWLRD